MRNEKFPDGVVVDCPYLWGWQHDQGQIDGDKQRPACLAIVIRDARQGINHLVILAISSTEPKHGQLALEIPGPELRRVGLSLLKQGWITISEYNCDILERSFYFEPGQKPRGQFTKAFTTRIALAIRPMFVAKAGKIDRT